ncbi:MAG: hypothetical protein HY654_08620 [Acidobacteria bacterium]|nr:hypothetical protein [Acidobacteriota bacterium]
MTEDELRALVRDAVARHLGRSRAEPAEFARAPVGPVPGTPAARHPSHLLLPILPGSEMGGPCLIEPVVRCTHCGYCQSYGH